MTTKEIKKWIKETFGLKTIRVNSSRSMNPYFTAWIPSDNRHLIHAPLSYSSEFPMEFRELALSVIYGPMWKSLPGREGNAGNVDAHSVGMHESEWDSLILNWDTKKWKFSINFTKSVDSAPKCDKVSA
jgi:hypothetical protein